LSRVGFGSFRGTTATGGPDKAALGLDNHRSQREDEEKDNQDNGEVEQGPLCTPTGLVYPGVAASEDPSQTATLDLKENGYNETNRDDDLHNLQIEQHVSTSKLSPL
jgi:hypothetical protein